jgi:hypothetical protein
MSQTSDSFHFAVGGDGAASGTSGVARPVATSYNEMTSSMIAEMSAQLARMGQLAMEVETLKSRHAVLEAELAVANRVRLAADPQCLRTLPYIIISSRAVSARYRR